MSIPSSLQRCPRCASRHSSLRFIAFDQPAGPWTHWAMCPKRLEPVLYMAKPMGLWNFIRSLKASGVIRVEESR